VVAKKDTLYSSQGVDFTVTLKAAFTAVYAGGAGGYWMNDIWIGLTNPYGDSAWVHSLVESGFDVYAGGSCSTNPNGTGLLRAGYWKNGTWVGLTNPYSSKYDAWVTSLVVAGSDVYAGGSCGMGTYSGDPFFEWFPTHAGYWKNGTWFVLDTGDSMVSSLVVLGSDWYAGGYITSSVGSSSRREAGYWKNGSWIALASPYTNTNPIADTTVCALVVQGNVYACGYCISSYEWFPCYWRNGTWIELTNPYGSAYGGAAYSLAVTPLGEYVGGACINSSGAAVPGYWRNGAWIALTNPYGSTYGGIVYSLAVSGMDVYAGGMCYTNSQGTASQSGYWKNGTWVVLANLSAVSALAVSEH
jgi:hypothetical protein